MQDLHDILHFLDEVLQTRSVPESYATNGLQIEASTRVSRVGLAVDACMQSLEALTDCQLMIVHHGIFWPKLGRLTGPVGRLVARHFSLGCSLYASHLPLDVHPELGNNAQILQQLDLPRGELFAPVGYLAEASISREALVGRVESCIGPSRLLPFGPDQLSRIAVSSGQASVQMVDQAVAAGAQLLLSGEAGHPIYHAAQQAGLNILLSGHYQTETWGVKALGRLLEKQFGLETRFVDFPTNF